MKYVLGLLVASIGGVAFAGNACQTVATPVAVPVQTVAVPVQAIGHCGVAVAAPQVQYQSQIVAVAAPQYVQTQVVQVQQRHVVAVAQPQHVVAVQKNAGNGRVRGNGGALGNVVNSIFSPQGILTIGGAAAGAAIGGPAGGIGGAAIGAALGNILGNGLGGGR